MAAEEFITTKGKPQGIWCAHVVRRDGQLWYRFPVASGFMERIFEFELTDAQLHVLQTDKPRFYFLYAVLHHAHQLRPLPTDDVRAALVDTILFADQDTVSNFLTQRDGRDVAHGAISSLAGTYLGWQDPPGQPRVWFRGT